MPQTERIFVAIASYRDAECEPTIRDLFDQATHPDRITVGVCWQHLLGVDDDLLSLEYRTDQIIAIEVDARESLGACWARAQVQKLWDGEDYFLQIDSHMRFEPGWDEKLIDQLKRCPDPAKSVLTGYPPAYLPPRTLARNERHIMFAKTFNDEGLLLFEGTAAGANNSIPAPVYGMFCSAGFLFGPATIIRDVPYDPHLYFYGEECLLSTRLWTHGYDIYHPCENVLYHYYKEGGDTTNHTHWSDNPEWHLLHTRAVARATYLLTGQEPTHPQAKDDIEPYSLGTERSLADYEAISGIDFKKRTISDEARRGIFHPPRT